MNWCSSISSTLSLDLGSCVNNFWIRSPDAALKLLGNSNLPDLILTKVSYTVEHSNGGVPVSRANIMQPKLHRSAESP